MTIDPLKLMESVRRLFAPEHHEKDHANQFEIARSSAEWRSMLAPDQYRVLREHGTERPGSSPLLKESRSGIYSCAGCGEPVYASDAKFDSGTGWPSFSASVGESVETQSDRSILMARTEVHCARCGGHLGHRFADGPAPSGMRHCINGAALLFKADEAAQTGPTTNSGRQVRE